MNAKLRTALKRAVDERKRELIQLGRCPSGFGNETGYAQGCRCRSCTAAGSSARARRRLRPNVRVHNYSGYTNGCRCEACKAARAAWMRRRRGAEAV
jgi:hypothetical protein